MKKLLVVFLAAVALPACTPGAIRTFDDGVFVSREDPAMRVTIDPDFEYLGPDRFMLGETHSVERHHFVKREANNVTALIVFQFEGIVDGVPGKYEFNIPPEKFIAGSNYRFSAEPVRLGSHDYVHNTWAFDTRKSAREEPGKESDRMLQLLDKQGYIIDDGLIMARYVRAVGAEQSKEIIVFYMETLSSNGFDLSQFPDDGPVSTVYDRLSADVVARSRKAFQVLPDE